MRELLKGYVLVELDDEIESNIDIPTLARPFNNIAKVVESSCDIEEGTLVVIPETSKSPIRLDGKYYHVFKEEEILGEVV